MTPFPQDDEEERWRKIASLGGQPAPMTNPQARVAWPTSQAPPATAAPAPVGAEVFGALSQGNAMPPAPPEATGPNKVGAVLAMIADLALNQGKSLPQLIGSLAVGEDAVQKENWERQRQHAIDKANIQRMGRMGQPQQEDPRMLAIRQAELGLSQDRESRLLDSLALQREQFENPALQGMNEYQQSQSALARERFEWEKQQAEQGGGIDPDAEYAREAQREAQRHAKFSDQARQFEKDSGNMLGLAHAASKADQVLSLHPDDVPGVGELDQFQLDNAWPIVGTGKEGLKARHALDMLRETFRHAQTGAAGSDKERQYLMGLAAGLNSSNEKKIRASVAGIKDYARKRLMAKRTGREDAADEVMRNSGLGDWIDPGDAAGPSTTSGNLGVTSGPVPKVSAVVNPYDDELGGLLMPEPLFRRQRNKRTGEVRELISEDGGQTWSQVMLKGDPGAPPAMGEGITAPESPPTPPQEPGLLDREFSLRDIGQGAMGMGKGALTGANELAAKFLQGASGGYSDELLGMAPWSSPEQERATLQRAGEGPVMSWLGPAAEGAGMAGLALASPAAGARTALGRVGAGALEAGTAAAGYSDGDMTDRVLAFLAGGGLSGGLGAGAEGIGAGLRAIGPKVAKFAGSAADGLRGRAISTPGDLTRLSRDHDINYTEHDIGQAVERLGLANKVLPQSARQYADKAGVAREQLGEAVGAALDAAGDQGAHGSRAVLAGGLRGIRGEGLADMSSAGHPRERAAQELIDRLGPTTARDARGRFVPVDNTMTPRELHTLKTQYEKAGGYKSDRVASLSEGMTKEVNRDAAAIARGELHESMGLALPDTREAFEKSNREYGFAATIDNLARERAIQNNRHTVNLPAAGAAGLGFSIGNVPGAVAGYYGNRLAHSYGQDMGANTMRALQWMGEGAGRGGPGALRRMAPQAIGRASAETETHARKVGDEGRGYKIEGAVAQALATRPQMLGKWQAQLQEAQQSGDAMRMAGLLSNLNRDPEFRETVGRQLMQMTARGGGQ